MSSTLETTLHWLQRREPQPPFDLQHRLVRAAERTRGEHATIQDLLADAAFDMLRSALRGGDDRGAAKDLLTADALLTYACEAAAEESPEALEQLLLRLEIDDFQSLLPTTTS